MIEKRERLNKVLNYLSFVILTILTLVFFIQFNILGSSYIRDIPNIIRYNDFRFNISCIYSNAFFYGVNPKFIIYAIIFNIFAFIPVGVIINKTDKNSYFTLSLWILIYEIVKSLLGISQLSFDMIILHYLGLWIGHRLGNDYNKQSERIVYKGKILIICVFLFSIFTSYKQIKEIFVADLTYIAGQKFIDEKELFNEVVTKEWGSLYEPYQAYLKNRSYGIQIKGQFEGMFVKGDMLSIKVDGKAHQFYFNERSTIIDKRILDYDNNKIFVHPGLNTIFSVSIDDKTMCKLNERIAILSSSAAQIDVIYDENRIIKYICTTVEEYKSEAIKF